MLGFITSKLGVALIGALIFAGYTGFIWIRATDSANARWAAKVAAATEIVRQEQKAHNRRSLEALRVLVDVQTKAREKAERETQEVQNALAANRTDTTLIVDPELDELLCRADGGRRAGGPCSDTGS